MSTILEKRGELLKVLTNEKKTTHDRQKAAAGLLDISLHLARNVFPMDNKDAIESALAIAAAVPLILTEVPEEAQLEALKILLGLAYQVLNTEIGATDE